MKQGYDLAKRLVDVALLALDTEARWSAGESAEAGRPYQTEMRELREAADEYLNYRQRSMDTPGAQMPPAPEPPAD
jgi:hypothetical protein